LFVAEQFLDLAQVRARFEQSVLAVALDAYAAIDKSVLEKGVAPVADDPVLSWGASLLRHLLEQLVERDVEKGAARCRYGGGR
jgi:hypothetical protein